MAGEWDVIGFGKIKSNRKVICIRSVCVALDKNLRRRIPQL